MRRSLWRSAIERAGTSIRCGKDGVEWTLARRKRIGFAGLKGEELTTILKSETCTGCNEARSKRIVVALDQRNDVAVAIDDGQIRSLTAHRVEFGREIGGQNLAVRVRRIDRICAAFCKILGQELINRYVREAWVSDVLNEIRIG